MNQTSTSIIFIRCSIFTSLTIAAHLVTEEAGEMYEEAQAARHEAESACRICGSPSY